MLDAYQSGAMTTSDGGLLSRAIPPVLLPLSPVARYLSEGLTNKEIATNLNLSEHTVKDDVKRLMKKAQVTTRTALVSRLLRQQSVAYGSGSSSHHPMDTEIHELAI